MVTMNVSLPDRMKDWVESRTRAGRFSNASDYVRHLIRKDQERQAAIDAVRAEITAGIESGAPRALDSAALKARMRERHDLPGRSPATGSRRGRTPTLRISGSTPRKPLRSTRP